LQKNLTRFVGQFFTLVSLTILLYGCNLVGTGGSEPPLPTIVPVTDTPAPTATAPPAATATPTTEPENEAVSQAEDEADAAIPTAEVEPTATATLVASPTPEPALPTPSPIPPTVTPAETQRPALEEINLKLVPVAGGFTKPLFLTHAGDGSERLFVVEQAGRILILKDGQVNPTPFLDIVSIVGSDANEQGLLSVAFHPEYAENGLFFINYTNREGNTVIARYSRSDNPDVADPNSAKILMTIGQPYSNHNGGQVAFGPDGYLYIGMGDGGAANDPQNRAQNLETLLGKILRVDVNNGDPYGVPQNNPFVGQGAARPEIWSYGWRNPWRFSFDIATNDMYIADVGQNQYEEVHVEWASLEGGRNYGWRIMEGAHCFNPTDCDPASLGLVLPVTEYDHGLGCSITGGYVYRGAEFPNLEGIYIYGDYCSGIIWGIRYETDNQWSQTQFMTSSETISSFGQDWAGEIYLVDHQGDIFKVGY